MKKIIILYILFVTTFFITGAQNAPTTKLKDYIADKAFNAFADSEKKPSKAALVALTKGFGYDLKNTESLNEDRLVRLFSNKKEEDYLLLELKARDTAYGKSKGYLKNPLFTNTDDDTLFNALQEIVSQDINVKSLYDDDDRQNPCDLPDLPIATQDRYKKLLPKSKTVCAFFLKEDFVADGSKIRFKQRCYTLHETQRVCPTERFAQEPTQSFCTGFGVGKDTVITAGHCIDNTNYKNVYLIFGFEMTGPNPDDYRKEFDLKDVYEISQVVKQAYKRNTKEPDFCVLKINKPLPAERVATYRKSGEVLAGEKIYVIGHPCGLTLKLAPGAKVRPTSVAENDNPNYFVTNLDTYSGNSGSPVFNDLTGEVEGILVRGPKDFVKVGSCYKSVRYAGNGGDGEDVSRIALVLPFLK